MNITSREPLKSALALPSICIGLDSKAEGAGAIAIGDFATAKGDLAIDYRGLPASMISTIAGSYTNNEEWSSLMASLHKCRAGHHAHGSTRGVELIDKLTVWFTAIRKLTDNESLVPMNCEGFVAANNIACDDACSATISLGCKSQASGLYAVAVGDSAVAKGDFAVDYRGLPVSAIAAMAEVAKDDAMWQLALSGLVKCHKAHRIRESWQALEVLADVTAWCIAIRDIVVMDRKSVF